MPVTEITFFQVTHHIRKRSGERVDSICERHAFQAEIVIRVNLDVKVESCVVDVLSCSFRELHVAVFHLENHPQPYDWKEPVVQPIKAFVVVEMDDALVRDVVLLDAFFFQHHLHCLGVDGPVFHQFEGIVCLPELGFKSDDEPDETGY